MQHEARTFRQGTTELSVVLYLDAVTFLSPRLDHESQLGLPVALALRVFWFVFVYWACRRWCGLRAMFEHRALRRQLRQATKADVQPE